MTNAVKKEIFEETIEKKIREQTGQLPGTPVCRLKDVLEEYGQKALEGRKFIGIEPYERPVSYMIYRIDEYKHNKGKPFAKISNLTGARIHSAATINITDHSTDIDVTNVNLKLLAKKLELSTEHFHWYL
ncbi:hypothetical protein JW851_00930 [Candidatus Woesearchaeota archaeon]|nr:hypothetical protein [Candidatus Woesearchaeota archaeon]